MNINKVLAEDEPLVSVLIPCFNHEQFIIECLESVKRDSYGRIELLFLDDGSSDNSYPVAVSWLQANKDFFEVVSYATQSNRGICPTFNTLVEKSTGDFIFILASDDQVAEQGISQTLNYYQQHCNKPTLLFTDLELIDYKGKLFAASGITHTRRDGELLQHNEKYLSLDLLINWGIPYMQQFYPRELYDFHGGYCEQLKCEDYYFALKNIACHCVAFAPVISRSYRLREDGASVTPGLSAEDYHLSVARALVAESYSPGYKILLWILAKRDFGAQNSELSLTNHICRIGLKIFMKITRLYFKASSK